MKMKCAFRVYLKFLVLKKYFFFLHSFKYLEIHFEQAVSLVREILNTTFFAGMFLTRSHTIMQCRNLSIWTLRDLHAKKRKREERKKKASLS